MIKIIRGVGKLLKVLNESIRKYRIYKSLMNDDDIQFAVRHPRTVDFDTILKKKLKEKDYDLIGKIERRKFRK